MQKIPSIYNSQTLGHFLTSYVDFLKKEAVSIKEWAESLGVKSRITFKHYLSGKRKIAAPVVNKLAEQLDMTYSDKEMLVIKNSSASAAQLGDVKPATFTAGEDFFETPLNTIILNLCGINRAVNELIILAALSDIFSSDDIKKSIQRLLQDGLIAQQPDQTLKRVFEGVLTTAPGKKSLASKKYFQDSYALANRAWDLPLVERELGAFTLRLDSKDFLKVKDLVRNFRTDICKLAKAEKADAVYHCTVAVFPVIKND